MFKGDHIQGRQSLHW